MKLVVSFSVLSATIQGCPSDKRIGEYLFEQFFPGHSPFEPSQAIKMGKLFWADSDTIWDVVPEIFAIQT